MRFCDHFIYILFLQWIGFWSKLRRTSAIQMCTLDTLSHMMMKREHCFALERAAVVSVVAL